MGSSTYNELSEKQLEDELIDAGSRLLMLPSSSTDLRVLLETAEKLLIKVRQQPPRSTGDALLPAMKALVTDELLKHTDVNIQVAVASCINELTRITAPNPPYGDDEMKEVFRLFVIAFQQLSCNYGPNYSKAARILETVAKVRSCLILLDIDCDSLIFEMFHLFFTTIRSDHPISVLKHMESIMTLVVEESDEISFELLRPLLASVKMDNKSVSPVSWELGETVFKTCSTKLRDPIREAVKTRNLDVDDYAGIISSLCEDASNGQNTVAKEVLSAAKTNQLGLADAGLSKLDGHSPTEPEDNMLRTMGDNRIDHLTNNSVIPDSKGVDAADLVQSETPKPIPKKRGRPPSWMKAKKVHEGKDSCEVAGDGGSEKGLDLPSKQAKGSLSCDSSQKGHDSANQVSLLKKGMSRKKRSMSNQTNDSELLSTPRGIVLHIKRKERCCSIEKNTGKKSDVGSRIMRAKKKENLGNETEEKDALLLQRNQNDETTPHKHDPIDVMDKASKSSRVDYGQRLVNTRIQVWWPMDKEFYSGTVKAYDSATKKHKIKYDDDEEEILNLRKERWEMLGSHKLGKAGHLQKQETNQLSTAEDSGKSLEKTRKRRKSSSLKKEDSIPSSKRSKSESHGGIKPGENPSLEETHEKNEHKIAASETKLKSKEAGDHACKEEMEISVGKPELET